MIIECYSGNKIFTKDSQMSPSPAALNLSNSSKIEAKSHLNCSSKSNHFIWIDSDIWVLASQLFYKLLDGWNTCWSTHKDNLIKILEGEFCIPQWVFNWCPEPETQFIQVQVWLSSLFHFSESSKIICLSFIQIQCTSNFKFIVTCQEDLNTVPRI